MVTIQSPFSKRKKISKIPVGEQIKKSAKVIHKRAFLLQKNKQQGAKWKDKFKSFSSGF